MDSNEYSDSLLISDKNGYVGVALRSGFDSAKVLNGEFLISYKYMDGAIADKNGNIILDFAQYQEDNNPPLSGMKLSILGDSISTFSGWIPTGYATHYPKGDVTSYTDTWWWKLITMSGMTLCRNASWSGSRVSGNTGTNNTANAAAGCSLQRIADLTNPDTGDTPDIIICYISTNDWAGGVQIGTFTNKMEVDLESDSISTIAPAYALMLYRIRTTYPNAVVYCVTSLEGRRNNGDTEYPILNANNETLHELNHNITEIAHMFGARVIDLNTCGIHYWNVATYMWDGTLHPNAKGTTVIAKTMYRQLMADFKGGSGL